VLRSLHKFIAKKIAQCVLQESMKSSNNTLFHVKNR